MPHQPHSDRQYAVDERLVMPETRFEVIDGEVVYVSPADPPHATRHLKLAALLQAYVGDDYVGAADMLTRTSEKNDFAPDASIYPKPPDPATGGRQLEELAFEIVSTQRLNDCARKAAALATRGVRRIFAIDVERNRALEWSQQTEAWQMLAADGAIEDRVFVAPLPLSALVDETQVDDAVARALIAKGNPVLMRELERRVQAELEKFRTGR